MVLGFAGPLLRPAARGLHGYCGPRTLRGVSAPLNHASMKGSAPSGLDAGGDAGPLPGAAAAASSPTCPSDVLGSRRGGGRRLALQALLGCVIVGSAMPAQEAAAKDVGVKDLKEEAKSGALSGFSVHAAKQIFLHPLDTVKVRLQMGEDPLTRGSLLGGVYKGFVVPFVVNSPASSLFFAVKDPCKLLLQPSLGNAGSTIAAIFAAQWPYWLVRQPSEAIKVRSQAAVDQGKGAWQAVKGEFASLDPRGEGKLARLFEGYLSNIAYAFPADAAKFVVYDVLKKALGGKPKDPLKAAGLGAFASCSAQILSSPLDLARNRIMAAPGAKLNIPLVVSQVVKDEGILGLFVGITPRIARAIVSGAIQFTTYELVKNK